MNEIFWQYPVITEKTFFLQNHTNPNYIGFPWATIIDKKMNLNYITDLLSKQVNVKNYNITCCQHILFRKLIKLFVTLGIKVLYTPHKQIGEDIINGIIIKPCPLYAVNIEDDSKNSTFDEIDFMTVDRPYLYSFQGAFQKDYLTNIRQRIFNLESKFKDDVYINSIGGWHFNEIVYTSNQNPKQEYTSSDKHKLETVEYNKLLYQSKFSLCPSGTGPNSIRFWEALAAGSIPVLLSDTLQLPNHPLWSEAILKIPEKEVDKIDKILRSIPEEKQESMRSKCIEIYEYFKDDFINSEYDIIPKNVVHYCCGSYEIGDFGGVARYDSHIKMAFPHRIFFKGPQNKEKMLKYISECHEPIIFTDNHLSCDIPNEYHVYLVHHGCARKTAEKNPDWDPKWKNLCVNGQNQMIEYRQAYNTTIVSISEECTKDFTKYYGEKYTKFKNTKILHTSELNESQYKIYDHTSDNKQQLDILGNWGGKKGDIRKLKESDVLSEYNFNQLNINGRNYNNLFLYNNAKQKMYLNNDIFLQISNSEGNSYATLDAFLCGMVIVSTPIGLLYEVPEDCYVKIDVDKIYDAEYIKEKIDYAWSNRQELSKNVRAWYLKNCRFTDWIDKMHKLITTR